MPIDEENSGLPQPFQISSLVDRFEHYAVNLKEIKHVKGDKKKSFMHLDLETLQQALTSGIKFPALFLQTPDVEKAGSYDNMSEQFDFTYVIVMKLGTTKAKLIDDTKQISDKIFNRTLQDAQLGILPSVTPGSSEGLFGPVGDGLYGWAKSMAIATGYDGQVVDTDWEDL